VIYEGNGFKIIEIGEECSTNAETNYTYYLVTKLRERQYT